ncbi:Histone H4, partial [Phytophthora megakarya]
GLGKGVHGNSAGGAKRHCKFIFIRDNIQGITRPAIRRLARRAGVMRMSSLVYEETRAVLRVFPASVIRDALTYMEHDNRKTIKGIDVLYALKRQGRAVYGFEQ